MNRNVVLPATKAKTYFETLGYVFPAEVNPADYLLDIIGGEAKCQGDSSLTHTDLPERWRTDTTLYLGVETVSDVAAGDTEHGAASSEGKHMDPKCRESKGFWGQLVQFTKRGYIQQYRPFRIIIA
eukprot:COSAG05_NODE_3626_length_1949_cov_1.225946_2_plen_126_part_00